MAEKFSKLMTDTKPQIQRNSENTKYDKYPQNLYPNIPNYRKPKIKVKKVKKIRNLICRRSKTKITTGLLFRIHTSQKRME